MLVGLIGRHTRGAFIQISSLYWMLIDMFQEMGDSLVRGRWPIRRSVFFEQTNRVGVGSISLVAMVSFFIGLTMAILIGSEMRRYGTERLVPELIAIAFSRELGPLMTGIVLAARIGAAFTAELGTMTVSEEVEAIEAMGLGPLRYLIAPRVLAITLLTPSLVVISNLAALFGAYLVCVFFLNIAGSTFLDLVQDGLRVRDITIGMLKSIIFGLIIGLVACYRGLTVKGGAAGVGTATTSSVVTTITSVIGSDTFLNIIQQVLLP